MHNDRPILRTSVAPWGSGISCEVKLGSIYKLKDQKKTKIDLQIRQTVFQWIHGQPSSFNDAKIYRLHGETNALWRQRRRRSFQMLIIHCESHYVPNRLDRERTEGWDRKEINLMICRTRIRTAMTWKANNVTEAPDRTSARMRLGMITISSIGLSPGNVWRDRMVYDSSCESCRLRWLFVCK